MATHTPNPTHAAGDANTLRPNAKRRRDPQPERTVGGSRRRAATARGAPTENSLYPTALRQQERPAQGHAGASKPAPKRNGHDQPAQPATTAPSRSRQLQADARAVPQEVQQRFVHVGNKYFFPDGARAFTDRGRKLTTPSENTEVVRSLVAIAQARGWSDITISGTERFRKEAWFAAKLAGLEVRGYTPTEFEHERLIRRLAMRTAAPSAATGSNPRVAQGEQQMTSPPSRGHASNEGASAKPRARREGLITGRLIDHGQARYRHDPREPVSYFVRLETRRGEHELWGVDLERALKESLTQPKIGDAVGLRAVRRDPVTVKSRERDVQGKVIAEKELATHRNRWIVEQRGFFAARAQAARTVRDAQVEPRQAVKQHPELAGTYLQLHAAEIAAKQIRDPEDRRQFVATIRSALADSIARGEPLPPVRMSARAADRTEPRPRRTPERERAPVRG